MTEYAPQRTLTVDLGERSYPIHIGVGLLQRADSFVPYLAGSQVMIVTNETVARHYLQTLQASLPEGGVWPLMPAGVIAADQPTPDRLGG